MKHYAIASLALILGSMVGLAGCAADIDEPDAAMVDEVATAEGVTGVSESALVSCYGANCNGKSPLDTYCKYDAEPVPGASALIIDTITGQNLGMVEMRYSSSCKTKWGRVTQNFVIPYSKVALRDPNTNYTYSYPQLKENEQWVLTTMWQADKAYRVDGAIVPCEDGCDPPQGGGYNWVVVW